MSLSFCMGMASYLRVLLPLCSPLQHGCKQAILFFSIDFT